MTNTTTLTQLLTQHRGTFASVVPFNPATDRLRQMDFTAANTTLTEEIAGDTALFCQYINRQLEGYTYGIGGYNELRTVYARSQVFDGAGEPRRLHLGVDIWGLAGTPVFAPMAGTVHSFAFNNHYGDYGATIILQHQLEGRTFHTLYGHLALADIEHLQQGQNVAQGQCVAHFGPPADNGQWPPHLHLQVIENMGDWVGDYPGVCKFSEREQYLANCPDAELLGGFNW